MKTTRQRGERKLQSEARRGFALLVAVIFMSVMLTLGLALGALAYKQSKLTGTTIESQYAFYAADSALECVLYVDQQSNLFAYPSPEPASAPTMSCGGTNSTFPSAFPTGIVSYTPTEWVIAERVSLDSGAHCADVTIYKPLQSSSAKTYLFSQGYNVPCSSVGGPTTVARGLEAYY